MISFGKPKFLKQFSIVSEVTWVTHVYKNVRSIVIGKKDLECFNEKKIKNTSS